MSNQHTNNTSPETETDTGTETVAPEHGSPTTSTGTDIPDGGASTGNQTEGEQRGGNAEAAKYRVRLRETEAERDALTERVTAAEQSVIDYAISKAGIDPRLWAVSDIDLTVLRTDTGTLDITAVVQQAERICREVLGHAPGLPRPNPQQGMPSQGRASAGITEAFDPHRHR